VIDMSISTGLAHRVHLEVALLRILASRRRQASLEMLRRRAWPSDSGRSAPEATVTVRAGTTDARQQRSSLPIAAR
jgi:hypothetical protein